MALLGEKRFVRGAPESVPVEVEETITASLYDLLKAYARQRGRIEGRSLSLEKMRSVILETMSATSTVFLIIIGAFVFIPFMSLTELPGQLVTFLTSLPIGTVGVLLVIIVTYLFLGMFLEGTAMLVLTIPVVIPIAIGLQWDLIWFGIIMVIVLEMGMISPPVGINVFVVKSIAPDVPMGTIFRGIWPFWFAMAAMIVLLILFPQLALFLPETIVGG